ncbi:MAG TPA: hypothetical protein PLG59_15100 [bacterium]|nr:hypothetical protein [bacterium]HQP98686.1 hypothetical protein [bacterium]
MRKSLRAGEPALRSRAFLLWGVLFVSILTPRAFAGVAGFLATVGIIGSLLLLIALVPALIRGIRNGQSGKVSALIQDPRIEGIARDLFPDEQSLPPIRSSARDHFMNKPLPPGENIVSYAMKVFRKHGVYLPEVYAERVFVNELNRPFFEADEDLRKMPAEKIDAQKLAQRRANNLKTWIGRGRVWIEKIVQNHRDEVESGAEKIARLFLVRMASLVKQRDPVDDIDSLLRHECLTPQERRSQDADFFYSWLQAFEKSVKNSNIMKPEARHMVDVQPGVVERAQTRILEVIAEYLEITSNRRRLHDLSPAAERWNETIFQLNLIRSESFSRRMLLAFQRSFLDSGEAFRHILENLDLKNISPDDLRNIFQEHAFFPQRIVVIGNRPVVGTRAADQYNHDLGDFALPLVNVPDYGREETEEAGKPLGHDLRRKNAEGLRSAVQKVVAEMPVSRRAEMLREVFSDNEGPVDKLGRYLLILPIGKGLTYEDEMVLAELRFFPPSGLDKTLISVVDFAETDLMWNSEMATDLQRTAAYDYFLSMATGAPLLKASEA